MKGKKTCVGVLCTLLVAVLTPAILQAKDTIYWMEADAPPFYIMDGQFKGKGYQDLITQIIIENMPQYNHKHMVANISRHYQQWKEGAPSCALAMYKTPERQKIAYYSIPSVITLPTCLIIKKENFSKFGGKHVVSLKDILQKGTFVVGRSTNRSYGNNFDEILDQYGTKDNIFSYEGGELTLNLFKMLLAGRIDTLSGLPEEAMYLAEKLGLRDEIMILNVKENLSDYKAMITYTACSKNDWGKKTIEAINKVLLEQRPTNRYRSAYETWLDAGSIEDFRTLYRDAFLTRNQ